MTIEEAFNQAMMELGGATPDTLRETNRRANEILPGTAQTQIKAGTERETIEDIKKIVTEQRAKMAVNMEGVIQDVFGAVERYKARRN